MTHRSARPEANRPGASRPGPGGPAAPGVAATAQPDVAREALEWIGRQLRWERRLAALRRDDRDQVPSFSEAA